MENYLKKYLIETDPRHSDMVDAYAYAIAAETVKVYNEYLLSYVKKCPWWLPKFIFRWLVSKLFVLSKFKV